MEQDWLLDEYERLRLIRPYRPVSPVWRHLGWSAFWAVIGAATLVFAIFFSFSPRIDDGLLIAAGAAGGLAVISLGTAGIVAVRHRSQMQGPYEAPPEEPADSNTQMGTSRPARAMWSR